MNGFEKMKERLLKEGWYVGWNLPCCQSCAWGSLPYYLDERRNAKGNLVHPETGGKLDVLEQGNHYTEVNLSKVLFNHSQDCEVYIEGEECLDCEGEGYDENDEDCMTCFGRGEIQEGFDPSEYDTSIDGFICQSPEQQNSSYFCFDGSKEGVANFKAIIPIIEECGVKIDSFDESGKSRIELSW